MKHESEGCVGAPLLIYVESCLDKSPVEMNEDELRAWLLSIPEDELNELLALSDWTHPEDQAR